jgi:hypothetical protein
MRLALLFAAAVILVRDPTGKWAGDPLEPWFQSLQNKVGLYAVREPMGIRSKTANGTSRRIIIASSSKASGLLYLTMR